MTSAAAALRRDLARRWVLLGAAFVAGTLLGELAGLPTPSMLVALALTFAAGVLLGRVADVPPATATFGMIAGGAAGIVAIAGDVGADDRMVAVMQYLRVVVLLLLTPVLAASLFPDGDGLAALAGAVPQVDFAQGLLFVAVAGPAGVLLARLGRLTSPSFFGPMFAGAAMTLAGVPFAGEMPDLLPDVAFALIGVKVGLDFTVETLRQARAILPAVLGVIVLMLLACGLLGLAMAPLAGVSRLDGYLATTPGVLQVALATAIGMKANTTFVLSAQVLRLFIMLLAAPAVARWLLRVGGPAPTPRHQGAIP